MPQKHSFDYVKKYIYEISNGDCELLSHEYINCDSLLDIRCRCGKVFHKDFKHIQRKRTTRLQCENCLKKELSEKYSEPLENIISYINSTGCEYISGEYVNSDSILYIKCRCGKPFYKRFNKFKTGQDRCQECGAQLSAQSKIKYTAEYVQETLYKERGYVIDKTQYVASYIPAPCVCTKGHKFDLKFESYIIGKAGCRKCHNESQKGKNHPGWLGGENEVIDNIRKAIKDWKFEVMAYYGFKCAITGEYEEDLAIHHLKAFSTIIAEVSEKLEIPILRKIKDYDDVEDYYKLRDEVIKAHEVSNGIVLKRKIHNDFHDIYGRGENTPDEFNEFLINNYNTTLSQIQKTKKSKQYKPNLEIYKI